MTKNELINITLHCIHGLDMVTFVHDHLPADHQNQEDIMIVLNFITRNALGYGYLGEVISLGGDLGALTLNVQTLQ